MLHGVIVCAIMSNMKDINETIANRIRKYRAELKLTLRELAERVGITEATMQKYEAANISRIDVDMLKRIADGLSVSPEQLTGWDANWDVPRDAQRIADMYMRLNAYHQAIVKNLIDGLLKEEE